MRNGFARLEIVTGVGACRIRATTWDLGDAVSELAASLVALAAGVVDTAVRWPAEPGGAFLDFHRPTTDELALVIHEFADIAWMGEPEWLPVRGRPMFGARLPRWLLLKAFSDAFAGIRASMTAESYQLQWGQPFPDRAVDELSVMCSGH